MKNIKKKKIALSFLIIAVSLVFVMLLDFSPTRSQPVKSNKISINYNEQELQQLEYDQLEHGNFSSLEGNWKSKDKNWIRLVVDKGVLIAKGKRYFLSLGGKTEWGIPYLNSRPESPYRHSAQLTFYPEGAKIPVRLPNGKIDYTGKHDPTDKSKARLLFSQTILTAEGLQKNVCYRRNF